MATLRLESYDENVLELPEVCMQCGAPATLRKRKTFSWFPQWIWVLLFVCNVLIFAIVAAIMTKRRTVQVPLCEEHKNHWLWRQLLVVGSLLGLLAIGVVSVAVLNNAEGDNPLGGILCFGSVILLVAWIIMAAIVQSTSIRPKEITDRGLVLSGVSPAFIEAYEKVWLVSPERLDELARERWNQGRRRAGGERPSVEDSDRVRPADEYEDRQPPDTFHEGTS